MGISTYLETEILNAVLRATAYATPATVYLALFQADPTDVGTGELALSNYARQAITFAAPSKAGSDPTACLNSNNVQFPAAGASWGTINYIGIYDAVSGGNLLYHGALTAPKSVAKGEVCTFYAGEITATLQ